MFVARSRVPVVSHNPPPLRRLWLAHRASRQKRFDRGFENQTARADRSEGAYLKSSSRPDAIWTGS
jgi:hypothetical protein